MRQPVTHPRSAEEYCRQLDTELIDQIRRRAAMLEARQRLADASQIRDPVVLDALAKLGFDDKTASLLFVVPMVQVAWADGSVTQGERDHIIANARLCGVIPGTPAYERLISWFDQQPSAEFFSATLRLIAAVLSSFTSLDRTERRNALLRWCQEAAAERCRIFGWRSRVCAAKRKVIAEIGRRLQPQ